MRVIFLDRDGVINHFPGIGEYVVRDKELRVIPRSVKAIRLLTRAGFRIFVISNQGCVSRKMITKRELWRMTRNMLQKIQKAGGSIRRVYYCYHQTSDRCDCKKPKTLMLKKATRGLRYDKKDTYFVGDSREDMECARDFGCRSALVLSGRSKKKDVAGLGVKPDLVKKDLYEVVQCLLKKRS